MPKLAIEKRTKVRTKVIYFCPSSA